MLGKFSEKNNCDKRNVAKYSYSLEKIFIYTILYKTIEWRLKRNYYRFFMNRIFDLVSFINNTINDLLVITLYYYY